MLVFLYLFNSVVIRSCILHVALFMRFLCCWYLLVAIVVFGVCLF